MIIAWDLDGVINDGVVLGRHLWLDQLSKEFELDGSDFASFVFQQPHWDHVLLGSKDISSRVTKWLDDNGREDCVSDIIDFWHHNDVHFDQSVFRIVDECRALGHVNILVSNQDATRCDFVSGLPDIQARFVEMFCSSRLHVKKSNPKFYSHIENELSSDSSCRFVLIDDDLGNTRTARTKGWDVYWVDAKSETEKSINIQNFIKSLS